MLILHEEYKEILIALKQDWDLLPLTNAGKWGSHVLCFLGDLSFLEMNKTEILDIFETIFTKQILDLKISKAAAVEIMGQIRTNLETVSDSNSLEVIFGDKGLEITPKTNSIEI